RASLRPARETGYDFRVVLAVFTPADRPVPFARSIAGTDGHPPRDAREFALGPRDWLRSFFVRQIWIVGLRAVARTDRAAACRRVREFAPSRRDWLRSAFVQRLAFVALVACAHG